MLQGSEESRSRETIFCEIKSAHFAISLSEMQEIFNLWCCLFWNKLRVIWIKLFAPKQLELVKL